MSLAVHLETVVEGEGLARAIVLSPPRLPIAGTRAQGLGGNDHAWSAEHLLLGAIGLEAVTTLAALAAQRGIHLAGWHARVRGRFAGAPEPTFGSFAITLTIRAPASTRRVIDGLAEEACRSGAVARLLRAPIAVDVIFVGTSPGLASVDAGEALSIS